MIHLGKALSAWQTPEFNAVLKDGIEHLDADLLPLQQGLSRTSQVASGKFSAVILNVGDEPDRLRVKAGIFYAGIIAGCSCADDPTPVDEITEYCEVLLDIDKRTALATVTLLKD